MDGQTISHKHAWSLADGLLGGELRGDRYRYHDDATRATFEVDADDLVELGRSLHDETPDAYSLWCANTMADEIYE